MIRNIIKLITIGISLSVVTTLVILGIASAITGINVIGMFPLFFIYTTFGVFSVMVLALRKEHFRR